MADDLTMRGANPAEILKRFETRLRLRLNVPDEMCFVADEARNVFPESMPDRAYIITSEGSRFNSDADQWRDYLIETQYIDVTCFNRLSAIDDSSRAYSLTSPYETNLFEMKRRVLAALVGWRLDVPDAAPLAIASTVKAHRCGKPEFLSTPDGGIFSAFLPITFNVAYSVDYCNEDYAV